METQQTKQYRTILSLETETVREKETSDEDKVALFVVLEQHTEKKTLKQAASSRCLQQCRAEKCLYFQQTERTSEGVREILGRSEWCHGTLGVGDL